MRISMKALPQAVSKGVENQNYYSSVNQVKQYTGIRAEDLGFEHEEFLDEVLETWLIQIKDLINRDRNYDYTKDEEIPAALNNIALRMAANMVAQATLRRETPIVRVDDFNVNMVEDAVLTNAIKQDLRRFLARPRFRFFPVLPND